MKKNRKALKAIARQTLIGNYPAAIGAMILVTIISLLINMPFVRMINQGLAFMAINNIIIGVVGSVVASMVSVLLESGLCYVHLQIARQQPVKAVDMFYPFKNHPDRYLAYGLLMVVISFVSQLPGTICTGIAMVQSDMPLNLNYSLDALATLPEPSTSAMVLMTVGALLSLIGSIVLVIITLSWAMTPYLLLDDVDLTALQAIRLSRNMMKGFKWKLFVLYLSFLGWVLFSFLTLGLGLFWIIPYINQTQAAFYMSFFRKES